MDTCSQFFSSVESNELIERLFRAPVQRHMLPNGLTLVHRTDFSSEVVSVQVWVKTGSIHEDQLIGSGLSHYLEHMLFKGTERRSGKAISREVHAMGASINAYTTFDRTVYYIDGPSSAFEEIVDVLADLVLHSTLPDNEVESERDVILREIDMGLDDPDRKLMQALFCTAFQAHPYREPVIGHRELFQKVSADELRAYYGARYVPNNMVVSVVGAVAPAHCVASVEETFGSVERGRLAPVQIQTEPVQLAGRREDMRGDYNVCRGAIGYKVPHLSHPDSPKLDALAHALGGGESSLLWDRLRNKQHLVHYIDCRNWNPGASGLFSISYVCDPGRSAEVEVGIEQIVTEVVESGFACDVVDKACRQALSSEINGRKTMSGQASRLGVGEVVIGDIHYGRRYLKRLQSIGHEELQEVAARYLTDANRSAVTLGPASAGEGAKDGLEERLSLAPFERIEYESGARLLLQKDSRLPKVHLRFVFRGGPIYEPTHQRGVSALMAELLTKDTRKRSAEEISEWIEGVGGSFNATVGNNTINLSVELLPVDLKRGIELIGDAFTCPSFEADTFETEREAQIAGLKEEDDEILDYGFRLLREKFFGEHPYRAGADGEVDDLAQLTADDVRSHFQDVIRASNCVVSVCGDFDRDALLADLEPLLTGGLAASPFEAKEYVFEGPKAINEVIQVDREQMVVLQAYPDVGILDEDFVVAEVLNELFSGMSSRLFERVREDQGMAYYVGSSRVIGLNEGMFVFYAGTHPSQGDSVVREIEAEVRRVSEGGVTEEELARCRTRLKAARPMGRQTIGARAMHAALQLTYGLPLDDDAEHARKLDQIDAEQLARFAKKFFVDAKRVRLVLGPLE
jgi:zinc protease